MTAPDPLQHRGCVGPLPRPVVDVDAARFPVVPHTGSGVVGDGTKHQSVPILGLKEPQCQVAIGQRGHKVMCLGDGRIAVQDGRVNHRSRHQGSCGQPFRFDEMDFCTRRQRHPSQRLGQSRIAMQRSAGENQVDGASKIADAAHARPSVDGRHVGDPLIRFHDDPGAVIADARRVRGVTELHHRRRRRLIESPFEDGQRLADHRIGQGQCPGRQARVLEHRKAARPSAYHIREIPRVPSRPGDRGVFQAGALRAEFHEAAPSGDDGTSPGEHAVLVGRPGIDDSRDLPEKLRDGPPGGAALPARGG